MLTPDLGAAAAVVLGVVFAWAGAAKLVTPASTSLSFRDLGLPIPSILAVVVPLVELVLAVALLVGVAAAGPLALALLVAFSVVIGRALVTGRSVPCACFGSARSGPVSAADVVRNGALGVLAVLAAGTDGSWPPLPALALVGGATLVGRLGLSLAGLDRVGPVRSSRARSRPGVTRRDDDGPEAGAPAPVVPGVDFATAELTVVAFTSSACAGCRELLVALQALDRRSAALQVAEVGLSDTTNPVFAAFGVRAAPYVVTVDRAGRVRARGRASTLDEVEVLVTQAHSGG